MLRRSGRIILLLVIIAVTAAVVWRATTNEIARGRTRSAAQQVDTAAADAIYLLADLRASLHALPAPGQGSDFWAERAAAQIEDIRARITALEPAAAAANVPLADALTSLDTVATRTRQAAVLAADGRSRDAASIVFSDVRELIESMAATLDEARQAMSRAAASREGGMANEQSLLAGGLMSLWIVALILLVPIPSTPAAAPEAAASTGSTLDLHAIAPPARAPAEPAGAASLALHDTPAPPEGSGPAVAEAAALEREISTVPAAERDATLAAAGSPVPTGVPADTALLQSLAALCVDLGAVADSADLDPLLAHAASLMSARGLVVWLVNGSGDGLEPAVAHGYEMATLARVGALPLADSNLTSTAYRDRQPTVSRAAADHAAAVAVPIVAAGRTVGVLAAEVDGPADLDRVTAIAGVVAAQLANLFASPAVESA